MNKIFDKKNINKSKKMIILTSFIYLVLFTGLIATFSWFFINKEIEIDYGSEIVCEAGTSLEISMLQKRDEETLEETWTDYSGYIKYKGVVPKIADITGDGTKLYRPTSLVNNQETGELEPEGLTDAIKINEEGFGDYLELEVKFRTTSTMNVYFSGESSVLPLNSHDTNPNAFGDFSKDYIAGAIRIAFLEKEEDGSEELKLIWAPNPNVELVKNKQSGKYSLRTNGPTETYYYYKYDEDLKEVVKFAVTDEEYANKKFVIGSTKTTESMVNNSPILTTLSPELNEMVEQTMIIRIWFEGTDREADQALSGGQVSMNLKFIGMSEKEDVVVENKQLLDSIKIVKNNNLYSFENITTDVYYSLNGYSWTKYDPELMTDINKYIKTQLKDVDIYFKYPETTINYEYVVKHTIVYEGGQNE